MRIRKLLARISPLQKSSLLRDRFPQYNIGRWTYGKLEIVSWGEGTDLSIGSFCSFAAGSKVLLGGEHNIKWVSTFPFTEFFLKDLAIQGHPATKGDIEIGSDVWVGTDAIVLSGVSIGHGAVIGARSTVTRDVPPYAIAAGSPATVVGYRFDDEEIEKLLEIAWWNWPQEQIESAVEDLMSGDLGRFFIGVETDKYVNTRSSRKVI